MVLPTRALSWPAAAPAQRLTPVQLAIATTVLAVHGLALALAWQAAGPGSSLGADAHQAPRVAQAPRPATLLYVLPLSATPLPPLPAVALPNPGSGAAARPVPAALPALPAPVEAPAATGVHMAPPLARLEATRPAPTAPALSSLEPPSMPGLSASEALRSSPRLASASPHLPAATGSAQGSTGGPSRGPQALPGNPLPPYPEAAREDGLEGVVGLSVTLDEQGRVQTVGWTRRSGYALLDRAAREAVRAWRFAPALREGVAVAGVLALSIRFQLHAPTQALTVADAQAPQP